MAVHLCYVDESGTPDVPGNTSHFVLAGISIPLMAWKDLDREIGKVRTKYQLKDSEIHTAWLARAYSEQDSIPGFSKLSIAERRSSVQKLRTAELLRLQKAQKHELFKQQRKNYRKTEAYIHLTRTERTQLLLDFAQLVASWETARLFAECVDKIHWSAGKRTVPIDEQAFEQLVTRFEHFLNLTGGQGLLIHDNNETIAKRHTDLMMRFHKKGTLFTKVKHIVETPLFVDSQLTGMVQVADLCSYSLRRYLENGETTLFNEIFKKADRSAKGIAVGVRHYTGSECKCTICLAHRPATKLSAS